MACNNNNNNKTDSTMLYKHLLVISGALITVYKFNNMKAPLFDTQSQKYFYLNNVLYTAENVIINSAHANEIEKNNSNVQGKK